MNRKKKYVAIFLTQEQSTYSRLKKVRFRPDVKTIRYKVGKSYPIDVSRPTYTMGLKLFYFIDIGKGQLFFKDKKNGKQSPELIDMILKQGIIKQITGNLGGGFSGSIMSMVLLFGIGCLLGFTVARFMV